MDDKIRLTIVVTVFNEKKTILKAIEEVKDLNIDKEIIVIDNFSTDGTVEILKGIKDDSIKIIFQPENYGYGQSVVTGLSLAKGEYAFIQFSDLEYDISAVYNMLDLISKDGLDAVFGSRYYNIKKNFFTVFSMVKQRPYSLGSIITTFLINVFYKRNFTDIIGTKLYRVSSFKKINFKPPKVGFDFEVVSRLCKHGYRIKEVPVKYKPRNHEEGKKIKAINIFSALLIIFKIKFFE
jgi:glycosyltransferase involved in cell wall biosynthesis